MLPSGVPDLSLVKDFVHETDAKIIDDDDGPSAEAKDFESLPAPVKEIEKKLRDAREAGLKGELVKKECLEGEEPIRELFLVLVPRPDFDSESYDVLQKDFETHLTQVKKFAELRRTKILKKSEARKDTNKALDCLKEANKRVQEKKEVLKPYRDQTDETRKAKSDLMNFKRGLPVTSEKQLDQMIRDLEFRLEHETISLAEEREIPKQLRQLHSSRSKVRELEAQNAAFNERISRQNLSPADKEHLEKELKEFKLEQETYERMYRQLRSVESDLEVEIRKVSDELDVAVKKKDAVYLKLSTAREKRKQSKSEWQRNRAFSNDIKNLVKEGKTEEAERLCAEQVNGYMALLTSNREYRKEYVKLWETKRPNPMAAFEQKNEKANKKSSAKNVSSLHGSLKVLPGQSLPDAVVANVLKDAEIQPKKSSHKKNKASKTETPKPVESVVVAPVQKPVKIEEAKVVPTAASKKSKKSFVDPEFELPAVIVDTAKVHSKAEKKETEIDADALDKKKQEQQEARKEREAERRRKRAEAAKRKKEREEAEMREKQEAKAREAQQRVVAETRERKPSNPVEKRPGRGRKQEFKGPKTSGGGSRPFVKKQKTHVQKLQEVMDQYPILIGSSVALILGLVIFYFWFA